MMDDKLDYDEILGHYNKKLDNCANRRKVYPADVYYEIDRVKSCVDSGYFGRDLTFEQIGKLHRELSIIRDTFETFLNDNDCVNVKLGGNSGVTHDISTICDVCGEVIDKFTGVRIRLNDVNDDVDLRKIKETFGKLHFEICLRCWILSLGVKPKITELEKRNEEAFFKWKRFEAEWLKDK